VELTLMVGRRLNGVVIVAPQLVEVLLEVLVQDSVLGPALVDKGSIVAAITSLLVANQMTVMNNHPLQHLIMRLATATKVDFQPVKHPSLLPAFLLQIVQPL
jgi:hypothetical protein